MHTSKEESDEHPHGEEKAHASHHAKGMYLRFGAMILTAMVVMYAVMFVNVYEWSHVRWSESRVFMALTMGGAMGLVMLAWMLNMYRNTKANIGIGVHPTQSHRTIVLPLPHWFGRGSMKV